MRAAGGAELFIEILIVMASVYQLVAWTDKGKVKMIPSQVTAFISEELEEIETLTDRIGFGTHHEIQDILQVSSSYEKFGHGLLALGKPEEAFIQYARAAKCCLRCSERHWHVYEYYETVSKPLRARFFAMYLECKELVRKYPYLELEWDKSGLEESVKSIT